MADLKITELGAVSSPADADLLESVQDVATTPINKKITWTQVKAFLKTYFDTLYDASGAASTVQGNLNTHESDTSNPHSVTSTQVGLGNVDNTSDATKYAATATLTNKRIRPRSSTAASGDVTPALATANVWQRTALAGTTVINAPTGTPVLGEVVVIILKDNGTSRTLNWNATYKAFGEALPTATTISTRLLVTAQYDGTDWLTLWAEAV
jgi:hypothetical protein